MEAQRQYPLQTPRRKSHTGLNLGTGVATALTRHILVLCVLSSFVAKFDWDTAQVSVGAFKKNLKRFILYRPKIYHDPMHSLFLRIFKMLHGIMNNPVFHYTYITYRNIAKINIL
jgi:hypothetical protein